jgi:hypothetical protein
MGELVLGGLLTASCGSWGGSVAVAQSAGVIDLSGVPPNCDKVLPAAQRFVVLAAFNNDAVRDNNTGLVWEKSPQTATATWNGARFTFINKNVGGQKGWRLPSIPDLASLIDPSVALPGPTLPAGIPLTTSSRPVIGRRRRVPRIPPTRGSCTSALALWITTLRL